MAPELLRRARVARAFGISVMVVGFGPVLWFVGRALASGFVPGLPSAWIAGIEHWLPLHRLTWVAHPIHTEVLLALAGLAVLWLGAAVAARQNAIFEAERRAADDRLRRVQQYGGDGRIEPYIGSPIPLRPDFEPQ